MAYAIIVGGGKIGYYLARSLINRDFEVLLMEKDPGSFRRLQSDLGDVVMQGDGCDPLTLKAAGGGRAELLIAATGDDSDNLVVCQMTARLFGQTRIIARVNNPDNDSLFVKLGVHERINSTGAILDLIGQKVGHAPIILLGALEKSNIEVVEIMVEDGSPFEGGNLRECSFGQGSLVISILRDGQAMIPNADMIFQSGDVLLVLIPAEMEAALREFVV